LHSLRELEMLYQNSLRALCFYVILNFADGRTRRYAVSHPVRLGSTASRFGLGTETQQIFSLWIENLSVPRNHFFALYESSKCFTKTRFEPCVFMLF
ncbi:hypothetical protein, partial [Leptospira kirschneri]|uniref:hypothetical protein n=1 Tax=Leptospira kirschneri TaxID=29507 RepID=UPI001E516BB5